MSSLNPQQEIRASLCQQYLHAGRYEASQIIANVQALESFIFEGAQTLPDVGENNTSNTKNAEPEKTAVTENKPEAAKVEKAEEVKAVEQSTETDTAEAETYTSVDIRNALMNLAKKHGKDSVGNILSAVGAANVPAIAESDYPKVMAMVEAKQKEAA